MDVERGKISSFEGEKARVMIPTREDYVTRPFVIPWFIRKDYWGELKVGDEVVFAEFDDHEGVILCRFDELGGAKSHQTITIEGDCICDGGDHITDKVTLNTHTHQGVHGQTSEAQ